MMEYVSLLILGFLLAALLGRLIIPGILIISLRKRLFDVPDIRKVHHRPISRLGGVMFFPVILLTLCGISLLRLYTGMETTTFFGNNIISELLCLMIGLLLLYIIGVCDDLIGVSYRRKFLVQIMASAFIPLAGLSIHHFYGLFGIGEISPWIGVPLTMLLTVFIINAINLIDGIDGLASCICMEALVLLGSGFVLHGHWMFALLSFACLGALIPFSIYNVFGNASRGRKIFMGDTGSLTLGFILSLLSVKYITVTGQASLNVDGAPVVLVFSLLLVPCLDVCRVVIGRLRRKVHPFKPDKSHIHHLFLQMGFTPRRSLVLIQLLCVSFIVLTYTLIHMGVPGSWVFVLDLLIWMIATLWFNRIIVEKTRL